MIEVIDIFIHNKHVKSRKVPNRKNNNKIATYIFFSTYTHPSASSSSCCCIGKIIGKGHRQRIVPLLLLLLFLAFVFLICVSQCFNM